MKIEEENLEKLLKDKTLLRESFGGNGGFYNDYPCAGLNIRVDNLGRIEYIGNHEEVNYTLRVCLVSNENSYHFEIEGIYRNMVKDGVIKIARVNEPKNRAEKVLIKTMKLYNEKINASSS